MRKYTAITFTAKDTAGWGKLGDLIPVTHRPVLVLWSVTDDIDAFYLKDRRIKADKHFWSPVRLERRDEWVLVVTNVNGTKWTHDEVLGFLKEHSAPEGIAVMPISDDELLQAAMKDNVLRGRPWHHDLPA